MIIDSIETKRILFLPMLAKRVTLDEVASYESMSEASIENLRSNPEQLNFDAMDIEYHCDKEIFNENTHVKVRLLYHGDLNQNKQEKIDKAIIHFHGGGFVAMDSACHQNYTRQWANTVKVPIFSVDYRLAPKYPYPDPINDCFQAYVWILTQAKDQLGMDIESFVFAGDSAGGHLTISVAMLCILRGVTPPCGLVPLYPVLNLNLNRFYPSNLMFTDDEVLSAGFVAFCKACISRKGGNAEHDPILSPLEAPDALLRLLPPTTFIVCEIDGLRDQTYAMAVRMLKQGVPTHVHLMAEFIHGFCNMDTNGMGVNEFRRATMLVCNILSDMLGVEK